MSLLGTLVKIGAVGGGLWLGSKLLEKPAKKTAAEDEEPTEEPPAEEPTEEPARAWSGTIGDVVFTAEDLAEVRSVLTSAQASQPATALVKLKTDDNRITAEVRREPGVIERWRTKITTRPLGATHHSEIFNATAPNRPAAILRMLDRLDKGVT